MNDLVPEERNRQLEWYLQLLDCKSSDHHNGLRIVVNLTFDDYSLLKR